MSSFRTERRQHHEHQGNGKGIDEVGLVADLFFLIRGGRPVITHPLGQDAAGQGFHLRKGLSGAETGSSGPENRGRGIEVVAGDKLRALRALHGEEASQGDHIALTVPGVEVSDVFRYYPVALVGLNVHLVYLIEFVEEVDEGRAQVALQRLEDVPQGHLKGLRLCPVDIEVELGAVGIERASQSRQSSAGPGPPGPVHRLRSGG